MYLKKHLNVSLISPIKLSNKIRVFITYKMVHINVLRLMGFI